MNQKGRELTLKVVILDPEKAKWIWDAHLDPNVRDFLGVDIQRISNGDRFDDAEKTYASSTKFYLAEEGESFEEAIAAHVIDGYDSVEDAKQAAAGNVSPGTEYYVIDENHKILYRGYNK